MMSLYRPILKTRKKLGGWLVRGALEGLTRIGRLHPNADPARHGVEVVSDVAYRNGGQEAHLLDVYRPRQREGLLPTVLYVHGGGFRILSKETHWAMALRFARKGFAVFNINYRLAPKHRFPAAVEDVAQAFAWLCEHAAKFGGDPARLVLAGESAGANLVTTLAIAASYRRPEPYAAQVFDAAPRIRAVVAACGILQVSHPERFHAIRPLPGWIRDRIDETSRGYLPSHPLSARELEMADPLRVLEQGRPPERSLPPFFLPCGGRDPILDDTLRMAAALQRMGVDCDARVYPKRGHAFHAFLWDEMARECWRDQFAFLGAYV